MRVLPETMGLWDLMNAIIPGIHPRDLKIVTDGEYDSERDDGDRVHQAYDINGKALDKGHGTPICSPVYGTVVGVYPGVGGVTIRDSKGRDWKFIHMDYTGEPFTIGQFIEPGNLLGFLSDVGAKPGYYHLDLSVKQNGEKLRWVDGTLPAEWMDEYGDLIAHHWPDWYDRQNRGCIIGAAYDDFLGGVAQGLITRFDPLVLDLDGDGIETTNVNTAANYFDHDGDGFVERTGWVDSDDGFLVMDRNGDGMINDDKELFGDHTILKDGTRATNGFQALAELDSNKDGKIDSKVRGQA
jgi:hypothetical protein